jgi:adenylate cyclase
MPEWSTGFMRQWSELRRRRVIRSVIGYLVAGWLLLQVADVTFAPLGFPLWAQRALIIAVAAGFLPFCILAWIYDVRAGRIVRTAPSLPHPEASVALPSPNPVAATTPKPAPVSNIASIAILPFADLSQARDQDWFCDGLAEEIIDSLCCVRGLRVASRTASFRFRDGSVDPREIGRLLSVDAILEGSVRKAGERLKIVAQLIDTSDGYHLWSESFERGMEDVFAIQAEIAKSVAQALKLSLSGSAAGRFQRYAPGNLAAYEFYLRGRQLAGATSAIAWQEAPRMFRRAIEHDPNYAQAHAGLADSLAQQILWRFQTAAALLPEATAAAARALELAPDLAEAHVAEGHLRSIAGDHEGAVAAFERAVALNPNLHEAWYYYARHCYSQGDYAHAAELFQAAYRTRPDEYVVLALEVGALDAIGDQTRADAVAKQALVGLLHQSELEPDNVRLLYMAAGLQQRLGRTDAGRELAEKALALRPNEFAVLYNVACFYSLSGDCERALDLLEQAIRLGGGYADWMEHDSDLKAVREHPRFRQILNSLK